MVIVSVDKTVSLSWSLGIQSLLTSLLYTVVDVVRRASIVMAAHITAVVSDEHIKDKAIGRSFEL